MVTGVSCVTGVLREVFDDDDDGEQSSDDSCFTVESYTDKEDDDLESQSTSQNMAASESGVESSSVSELIGRRSSSSSQSSAVSLLSVLKAPTASDLSRKRTVLRNPPRGRKKTKGNSINDPTHVKPLQRVKEYPNEPFIVSNSKLFCHGCREELCLKKSSRTRKV